MKTMQMTCAALMACAVLVSGEGDAAGFVRSATLHGNVGGGLVPARQVLRQRQFSGTGPRGGSASRSVGYSHTPGSTTRSVNAGATGPNGASVQHSSDFSHQAGVGTTREASTTATGPNGAERSRTVDYSHEANGDTSRSVSVDGTRANGSSYSDTRSRTVTPAGN